jgi:hypothetical protein
MSAAIVQKFGANWSPGFSYAGSQSASAGSGITIGNFLIALVSNTGRTDTPTVVDTLNPTNVFTEVIGGSSSAVCSCSIWIAPILAGGASTVEATWGGSNNSHLAVYEVSGIGGSADQTDYSNAGAAPTPAGDSKTTTSAGELCFAIVVNDAANSVYDITPTGAWAWDFPGTTGEQAGSTVASQVQASAGAIQATFSCSSFNGGIAMATFGSGGGPPPPTGAAPVVCIMQ